MYQFNNDIPTVAARPVGLPVQADGIAWWRDGESLVPMPEEIRRAIYAESGHDFSADICPGATEIGVPGWLFRIL